MCIEGRLPLDVVRVIFLLGVEAFDEVGEAGDGVDDQGRVDVGVREGLEALPAIEEVDAVRDLMWSVSAPSTPGAACCGRGRQRRRGWGRSSSCSAAVLEGAALGLAEPARGEGVVAGDGAGWRNLAGKADRCGESTSRASWGFQISSTSLKKDPVPLRDLAARGEVVQHVPPGVALVLPAALGDLIMNLSATRSSHGYFLEARASSRCLGLGDPENECRPGTFPPWRWWSAACPTPR